ncbi:carotenoid oxygenase family protein [Novosphingobium sp.]|uniref:carotenoid oxygenase family protein n=1 Tax=Novosphingobium sp. TaxID=1874826 RepID=UPI002FE1FD1D
MATSLRHPVIDHAPAWRTDNPHLNGAWAPWTEETSAFDVPVEGTIPEDLAGALFRISANPRFEPIDLETYHWFDGDGMVGGIYIRDGKVSYRQKWVETASMAVELAARQALYPGLVNGSKGRPLPAGAPPMKNVANITAGLFAGRLLAYFEGGLPTEMHPLTLATRGSFDFHGRVNQTCAAHYKIDPVSGDMLCFGALGSQITYFQANASTAEIVDMHIFDIGLPVMMHDFAVTENYAIFFVTAVQIRVDLAMQGKPAMVWDESGLPNGTRIVLMNRHTHDLTWHDVGRQFVNTHNYNAYELDGKVFIHGHSLDRMGTPIEHLDRPVTSKEWMESPPSLPHRWTIDLSTGRVHEERLSDLAGDFPKINDALTTRHHRFGYWTATTKSGSEAMTFGLVKHDLERGSIDLIESPDASLTQPTEVVFVARRGAVEEDDGYLLSLWWNRETRLSELLVHSAKEPSHNPLARVRLPARLPYGPHGNWADAESLDQAAAAYATGN